MGEDTCVVHQADLLDIVPAKGLSLFLFSRHSLDDVLQDVFQKEHTDQLEMIRVVIVSDAPIVWQNPSILEFFPNLAEISFFQEGFDLATAEEIPDNWNAAHEYFKSSGLSLVAEAEMEGKMAGSADLVLELLIEWPE